MDDFRVPTSDFEAGTNRVMVEITTQRNIDF